MFEIDSRLSKADNLSIFKFNKIQEDLFYTNFDEIISSCKINYLKRIRPLFSYISSYLNFPELKLSRLKSNSKQFKKIQNSKIKPLMCPICLELMNFPLLTQCGHSFCRVCIYKYTKKFEDCPICKIKIRHTKYSHNMVLAKIIKNRVENTLPYFEKVKFSFRFNKHRRQLKKLLNKKFQTIGNVVKVKQSNWTYEKYIIKEILKFKNMTLAKLTNIENKYQIEEIFSEKFINCKSDAIENI
jgi:hypothetical protein